MATAPEGSPPCFLSWLLGPGANAWPLIGLGHQIYAARSKQSIDGWALVAFRKIPILIRGAPFIRTPGIKTRGNVITTFHPQRVSTAGNPRHMFLRFP
jgi:hypothetical protein